MQDGLAAMCGASPAERAKLGGLPDDARGMLGAQIAFMALRQSRAMQELKAFSREAGVKGIGALEESSDKDACTGGKAGPDSEQNSREHVIKRRSAFDARQEIEARLNKLGDQMLKAIELMVALEERGADSGGDAPRTCILIPDNGRGRAEQERG